MKKLLLLFSFIVLFTEAAFATHGMGGEMTYRYLGYNASNNTFRYRIKIAAYVDAGPGSNFCIGCTRDSITPTGDRIPISLTGRLGNNPKLNIYRYSTNQRIELIDIREDTMRVKPNLPPNCEPVCLNGIVVYLDTFVRVVEVPFDARGYIFYYSTGERNSTVNLGNGDQTGNTYQCIVPSPGNFPNSSPQFTDLALPFMLTNQLTDFINTAIDPDGDRLQYSLVAPYNGGGFGTINYTPNPYLAPTIMPYQLNYTALQPFGLINGSSATINSSSGLSTYLATVPGSYVVVIEISEFRSRAGLSDTLIGKTRRELQIFVRESGLGVNQCPPNPAPLRTSTGPTSFTINEGDSISFSSGYTDTDSIVLQATGEILQRGSGYLGPLARFPNVRGIGSVSSTFNWRTVCGTRGTYSVRLAVRDAGCPPSTVRDVYTINVLPFRGPQTMSGAISTCNNVSSYKYSVPSLPANAITRWEVTGGIILSNANNIDTVRVRWTDNRGKIKFYSTSFLGCRDSVVKSTNNTFVTQLIGSGDITICEGSSTNLSVTGGTGTYAWSPPNGLSNAFVANPVANPRVTTRYVVASLAASGCTQYDTVVVNVIPNLPRLADLRTCGGVAVSIGLPYRTGYNYRWLNSQYFTIGTDTSANPTLVMPTSNIDRVYSYILRVSKTENSVSCITTDTVKITVIASPNGQVINASRTAVCNEGGLTLAVVPQLGITYSWLNPQRLVIGSGASTTATVQSVDTVPRVQYYYLRSTNSLNCFRLDSIAITVNPLPFLTVQRLNACNGVAFQLIIPIKSQYSYKWLDSANLDSGSVPNPTFRKVLANATRQETIIKNLELTNRVTGCISLIPVTIIVYPLPVKGAGRDTNTCPQVVISLGLRSVANEKYSWKILPGAADTLNVGIQDTSRRSAQVKVAVLNTSGGRQTYFFEKRSENLITGCVSLDTVKLDVNVPPLAIAANQDSLSFCPGDTFMLGGNNAYISTVTFLWSPNTNISNSTLQNPKFTARNSTQRAIVTRYVILVTDMGSGCFSRDTVYVKVNPSPPVLADSVTFCSGNTVTIGRNLGSAYSYKWIPATGLSSDTASVPSLTLFNNSQVLQRGVYSLVVTNKSTGCKDSTLFVARVNPLPIPNAGAGDTICSGERASVGEIPVGRIFTYQWRFISAIPAGVQASFIDSISSSPFIVGINTTSTDALLKYTVKKTNILTTCFSYDTASILIRHLPQVLAAGQDTVSVCAGHIVAVGFEPTDLGIKYRWTPSIGLSNDTISNPVLSGQMGSDTAVFVKYILTATNRATLCSSRDSFILRVNPLPNFPFLRGSRQLCSGYNFQFEGVNNPDYSFRWKPNAGLDNLSSAIPIFRRTIASDAESVNDTLRCTITNRATGCVDSTVYIVTTNSNPRSIAGVDKAVCFGDSMVVGAPAVAHRSYAWFKNEDTTLSTLAQPKFGFENDTLRVRKDTLYLKTMIDSSFCFSYDTVVLSTYPRVVQTPIQFSTLRYCPFVQGIDFSVREKVGYTYNWTVRGGVIASGQGTSHITVNWGESMDTSLLTVVPTNEYGCVGKADSLPVIINQTLKPLNPDGEKRLCFSERTNQLYSTPRTNNSTYTWFVNDNGSIRSESVTGSNDVRIFWNQTGIGKLWVKEYSSTRNTRGELIVCEGFSDTTFVNVLPSPDSSLRVFGDSVVCVNTGSRSYVLPGKAGSVYKWKVFNSGGQIVVKDSLTSALELDWRLQPGLYNLAVQEITDSGCVGKEYSKAVILFPETTPSITLNADTNVCLSGLNNRLYKVNRSITGSYFNWKVEGGEFVSSDSATLVLDTVRVNWDSTSIFKKLYVQEISPSGCKSLFLAFPIRFDNTRLEVVNLTRDIENDSLAVLTFKVYDASQNPNQTVSILRRGALNLSFTEVAQSSVSLTEFRQQLPNDTLPFGYTVEARNLCNDVLRDSSFTLLTVLGRQTVNSSNLFWNRFTGWKSGVSRYEIYRKLDEELAFSLYETVSAQDFMFRRINGADGYKQTYRVRAVSGGGADALESWSNVMEFRFDNILQIPNVITPNGDWINENLVIKNLDLARKYGTASLTVTNRWGNVVYSEPNYVSQFDGSGLADGVYYLHLVITGEHGGDYKSTLTILR